MSSACRNMSDDNYTPDANHTSGEHHTRFRHNTMPQRLYTWSAIASDGELKQGNTLGRERQQVYLQLINQGYQPIRLNHGQSLSLRYWTPSARVAFIKQLAALLQAGLPLLEALRLIAEQHEHPGWRSLLNALGDNIAGGESLSDALRHYPEAFPSLYATLIAVGELTGKLDICCQQLAHQQEQHHQLQQKVKKALRYPCFVLGVALLVSIIMLTWVLPEFATLYASFDTPLPWLTQSMIALSRTLSDYAVPLCLFPLCTVLIYRVCRQRYMAIQRKEETLLLKIPLLASLLRGKALSHIFTLLALTQRAGLTLPAGLQAAATLPYLTYQSVLSALLRQIEQGFSVQQAIAPYAVLFPPPCAQLIRVGEETGMLDSMFTQLAQWHEQQTTSLADTLTQALEPMMMLIVGGIIGTLVIAMYLPIFQLGNVMANA